MAFAASSKSLTVRHHTCELEELGILGDLDTAGSVSLGLVIALSRLVAERRGRI